MACIVELRGTADALLREIVADGLPRLVRGLGEQDRELPRFVTSRAAFALWVATRR
jgi:hypothetical protein